ncbi:MAG: TolC family protein [Bacteroidales bacterium]|nr:TolC family protein [Bacteroidales bacterium]
MHYKIGSFASLIIMLFPFFIFAQENEDVNSLDLSSTFIENEAEKFSDLILPPLSSLLEAAENSLQIQYLHSIRASLELDYKSVKRDWLEKISLSGNYRYGLGASFSSTATEISESTLNYSNTLSSTYGISVGFGLPLSYLFEHKADLKRQEELLRQADIQIELALQENKLRIIETYTLASEQLNLLKTKAELVYINIALSKMKESDYLNGLIDLQELSSQKTEENNALSEYETAKATLKKAILNLEMFTNIKISNY